MRKIINKEKQLNIQTGNNAGFSLIEVLIAMVILAVLSFPILSNFASSAKANQLARRTENANAVAQRVAEKFKSVNLDDILLTNDDSENGYAVCLHPQTVNDELGAYSYHSEQIENANKVVDVDASKLKKFTFKVADFTKSGTDLVAKMDNIGGVDEPYVLGTDDEHYFVRVVLDPRSYFDGAGNEITDASGNKVNTDVTGNNINSYELPSFQDIDITKHFVIMNEITKYDNTVAGMYINDDVHKYPMSTIKKVVDVKAEVVKQDNKYLQNLNLTVSYYHGAESQPMDNCVFNFEIQKAMEPLLTGGNSEPHNVYLFYNSYNDVETASTSDCVWNNEINIHYSYPSEFKNLSVNNELKVYVIEQAGRDGKINLSKNNINFYVKEDDGTEVAVDFGRAKNDTIKRGANGAGPVTLLSNVNNWNDYGSGSYTGQSNNTLTSTGINSWNLKGNKLYNMEVIVYYGDPSVSANEVVRFTTTKENK